MLDLVARTERTSPRRSPREAGSVLIVEDDLILRESIVELLTLHGFVAAWATDGLDALSTFRADPADMILTDIIMPKLGGIALVKQIREYDVETPILILTGYASLDNCVDALRAGANDFIAKPFENDALVEAVRRGIEGARSRASVRFLDKHTRQDIRLSVPSSVLHTSDTAALVAEILVRVDAAVLAAGFRRRRLAIRRALEEALALGIEPLMARLRSEPTERADAAALEIAVVFDPRCCRASLAAASPIFETPRSAPRHEEAAGPARRHFLIHSFCDEATWTPAGTSLELVFFRPRTERPEKQGA